MSILVTPAQVLSALKALRVTVRLQTHGICNNLDCQLPVELGQTCVDNYCLDNGEPTYTVITELSKKWPKFSGIPSHPVPVPDSLLNNYRKSGIPSVEIYDTVLNKWVGEYGELRRELLDFLIEELENGNC